MKPSLERALLLNPLNRSRGGTALRRRLRNELTVPGVSSNGARAFARRRPVHHIADGASWAAFPGFTRDKTPGLRTSVADC